MILILQNFYMHVILFIYIVTSILAEYKHGFLSRRHSNNSSDFDTESEH